MKIGILTFHFAFNQGAVLQCYALQKYLESQGHEAYVINYRPKYHTVMHSARRDPFVYSGVFWKKSAKRGFPKRVYLTLRSFARCMVWNVSGVDRKSEESFRAFEKEHIHLTKEYLTLDQLRTAPPKLDAYISGSDQVWNPELLGQEFDPAYFLDFGEEETRRLTYAVSMGKNLDRDALSRLRDLCRGLDAVSLREYSQADIEATGKDVHICIDPTFLLDAQSYRAVESKSAEKEPYVFVYGFETNDAIKEAAAAAAKKYGCGIINGSPKWIRLGEGARTLSGYGPDRFLSLIKNARCVVTNSFHGTAFSVIYGTDLVTVPHTTRGRRMQDLLGKLGLAHRLYGGPEYSFETPIDYPAVREKLRVFRAHSEEYLKLALSGKKGEEIPHYPEDRGEV